MDIGTCRMQHDGGNRPDTGREKTVSRSSWFLVTSDEIEQIRTGLVDLWSLDAAADARKQEILAVIDRVRNRFA
jgi:hypothetical protein